VKLFLTLLLWALNRAASTAVAILHARFEPINRYTP
jgi:hypothetical protein